MAVGLVGRRAEAGAAPPDIGIQPWARSAARRRLSAELPPIQTGIGSWAGRGRAITSRALKCRPW